MKSKKFFSLVFDGKSPIGKADETANRCEKRKQCQAIAERLLEEAKKLEERLQRGEKVDKSPQELRDEAQKLLRRTKCITSKLVKDVKAKFESFEKIEIIQAPNEADAQLAFLATNGIVDFVISDDSDLIVYGCPKIIFKITSSGQCVLYEKQKFNLSVDWELFRWICLMNGCDYFKTGIPGFGLYKALKFIKSLNVRPPYDTQKLKHVLSCHPKVTPNIAEKMVLAEETFLHQSIYDPQSKCIKLLT